MAVPQWPAAEKRQILGKRISRVDGPEKASGAAKYAYDINLPGMLHTKLVSSRHALAKIVSIDTSAAEKVPGVKGVWVDEGILGGEARYAGEILAAVAAETEEIAAEAAKLVAVSYEAAAHNVIDTDPSLAEGRPSGRETGDVAKAMAEADAVSEGEYGMAIIAHCCLEPHGQVAEMQGDGMHIWASTQNVAKYADRLGESLEIPQNKITVECQYIGGGFGSKFSHDKWGVIGSLLSKKTGRPVKLMLDRDLELIAAGNRPSTFAKIKVGVKKDGTVTAIDVNAWGTGGQGGFRAPAEPYVFTEIPNRNYAGSRIPTNIGSQRAWRAPGHPQNCLITMAALADAAAAIKMDELDFFLHNLDKTGKPDVYREQLKIAADLIDYRKKAHPRGDAAAGPIKRGLGVSLHMWGGMGHPSNCDCSIHPDGSVEVKLASQDLGTGTRTTIGIVAAETLGLPLEAIDVEIGRSEYPESGGSGGSTTIGGVSASTRLAATAALNALLEIAAPKLGVGADALEAAGGKIREAANPSNAMSWKDACGLLGPNTITERGVNNPGPSKQMGLIDAGVGGVQIADVSVDIETGIVTMNELVAVQDCGLIVDLKLAESQVYGGMIMGIAYALYEECVYDPVTGRMLNADLEFYRLAGLKDVGKLKVHMMTGPGYDERGVIGLGEPPVISPGAAISNAVANACGVRVPHLPLTPERVIAALQKGGVLA